MEQLDPNGGGPSSAIQLDNIRSWSDFNRMYYVPRTIQKVPDRSEWEDAEGNWIGGREGIQLMHDTSTVGSSMISLLTSVRDGFSKSPLLTWPLLSDARPFKPGDSRRVARKVINDALTVRSLSELSPMSVPIQSPTT
ncbi:hypothetical protein B0H19DRAFT_1149463 [Mycena capillaripes]|nr:hypothetical protein B0H19DRAFT_1149463 [Mycena capillaripes]